MNIENKDMWSLTRRAFLKLAGAFAGATALAGGSALRAAAAETPTLPTQAVKQAGTTNGRKKVGILIFNDVEELDFVGPYEVFNVTRRKGMRLLDQPSPFETLLVAEKPDVVRAFGGLRLLPDTTTENCPKLDILLVPGGMGTRREIENARLISWIAARATEVETLTSVCTGALLLGKAGLLNGRHATTHWASLGWLRTSFPGVKVEEHQHVVHDGNIFTSAGISAGIDLALLVVASYFGEEVARTTARTMEYRYPDNNDRRV
jgi:transcriptional regulator GlxA family with amidase domain